MTPSEPERLAAEKRLTQLTVVRQSVAACEAAQRAHGTVHDRTKGVLHITVQYPSSPRAAQDHQAMHQLEQRQGSMLHNEDSPECQHWYKANMYG